MTTFTELGIAPDIVEALAGKGIVDAFPIQEQTIPLALTGQDVIGQAKGILMERHGIGADEAFERLVAMSQPTNVKVRDVAEYVVELRADLPADVGAPDDERI